jgi:hypothetical protein
VADARSGREGVHGARVIVGTGDLYERELAERATWVVEGGAAVAARHQGDRRGGGTAVCVSAAGIRNGEEGEDKKVISQRGMERVDLSFQLHAPILRMT